MIFRNAKPSDVDQLFDCFQSVSIRERDLREDIPSNGFFEYPLSFDAFAVRATSPLTLVCEDKCKIIAYMISYPLSYALDEGIRDPVIKALSSVDPQIVYHDQLFKRPDIPLFIAGRLFHTMDVIAEKEGALGVIGAIPTKPWINIDSTRLVAYQGMIQRGTVVEDNVTLGLYIKPFVKLGTPLEDLERSLISF